MIAELRITRGPPLRKRRALVMVALVLAAIVLVMVSLVTGEVTVPLSEVVRAILGWDASGAAYTIREFRAPRVVAAILAGVGLGAAGAVTQSLLKNPLASPDIIGVTAGASAAAVLALAGGGALGGAAGMLAGTPVAVAALMGGLVAGSLVLIAAWRRGLVANRVVLVGLGVNAGCGALTSWVLLRADLSGLATSLTWLTGSLNQVRTDVLLPVSLLVACGLTGLVLGGRALDLLRYDARIAWALGMRVTRAQLALLVIAVGLAAVVTAVAGPIPFVAFVAPQVAFVLLRTEGPPVVGAALVGAVMMLGSDLIAQRAFSVAMPVGVVTALVGIPVLLWVLVRGGRRDGR